MTKRKAPDGMIAVNLHGDERAKRALELAQVVLDIEAMEAEWKEKAKEHRDDIRGLEIRRDELAEDVATGTGLKDAQEELPAVRSLKGGPA